MLEIVFTSKMLGPRERLEPFSLMVNPRLPTCLCVKIEFVVGTISLSCELRSLSKAAFVHVRSAQLCTENGISIYMCSAVEVAWLAQNFRHSSIRV